MTALDILLTAFLSGVTCSFVIAVLLYLSGSPEDQMSPDEQAQVDAAMRALRTRCCPCAHPAHCDPDCPQRPVFGAEPKAHLPRPRAECTCDRGAEETCTRPFCPRGPEC
jgi:hypothetical protein